MPLTTALSPDGKELTIHMPARFDFSQQQDFRQAYQKGKGPGTRYVLDFSGAQYIDSSALGMLLMLREHAGGDRAQITLRACKPAIAKILSIAQFHKLFQIEQAAA